MIYALFCSRVLWSQCPDMHTINWLCLKITNSTGHARPFLTEVLILLSLN